MTEQETLNMMALCRLNYFSLTSLRQLYDLLGSATAIVEQRHALTSLVPDLSPRVVQGFSGLDEAMKRAEAELEYDRTHGIEPLCMGDDRYPQRLKECDDAPLMLFYKGTADLNQRRVVCIVGTRRSTVYGDDLIRRFMSDLRQYCPQVLIVSGLAYGIDICAHRNALQNGYETVGVLAHGLDDLYPPRHKQTAAQMIEQGGLLSEFFTCTNAEKMNFVRRNRIVAGMSDACILVESAAHGGGLITTRLSRDYNRDVFAFPGRVGDPYSEGCNNLIRDNGAALISNAHDFVLAMGWDEDATLQKARQQGIERQLFPNLSPDEKKVVDELQRQNDQQINMLTVRTGMPIHRLTALLFELEMKAVIRTLPGGVYHLVK